ncbi:MAG: hypothetical protein AB7V04_00205 [Desulfomonilaceae bacterium]
MTKAGIQRKYSLNSLTLALVIVVAVIFFLACWTWRATDFSMREDLVEQAGIVAKSIQLSRVTSLEGVRSEETDPNYVKLKKQLFHLRQANSRCRFLYILGKRQEGPLFFYVDSEPPGSEDESPPGQTYDEASASFHDAFTTGKSDVIGPVTDRWGSWVTAIVPLVDPSTGEVVAVLGMDINASTWEREVLTWVIFHVGLLLVLLFVLGSMWYAVRRLDTTGSGYRENRGL